MMKYCALSFFSHMSGFKNLPGMVKTALRMKKKGDVKIDKLLWRMLSDGAPRINRHYDLAIAFLEGGATYYVADHVKADKKAAFVHVDYNLAGYSRALDKDTYKAFDNIYTVSDEVKESFLVTYPEHRGKVSVMPNIIDYEGITKKSLEEGGFEDDYKGLRILTVSRLHPQKGVDMAVKAARLLDERGVDFHWHVLGDGAERDSLKMMVKANELEGKFFIEGAVDNPYPYMKLCDIYVQPSRFEGKSVAMQEALFLADKVIATDVRGNREYGEKAGDEMTAAEKAGKAGKAGKENCAVLCKPSPEGIADAVCTMAEDM